MEVFCWHLIGSRLGLKERTSRRASVSQSVTHVENFHSIVLFEGINTSNNELVSPPCPFWKVHQLSSMSSFMSKSWSRSQKGPGINPPWPRMTYFYLESFHVLAVQNFIMDSIIKIATYCAIWWNNKCRASESKWFNVV